MISKCSEQGSSSSLAWGMSKLYRQTKSQAVGFGDEFYFWYFLSIELAGVFIISKQHGQYRNIFKNDQKTRSIHFTAPGPDSSKASNFWCVCTSWQVRAAYDELGDWIYEAGSFG